MVAVHCDLFFAKGPAGHADLSRPRRESAHPEHYEWVDSKRELSNVGVYPLVFLPWLLGREVENVFAVTSNYFFAEHQKNDMEDFGVALLELEGGLTATLAVGRAGWRCHPMSGVNKTYLIGTKGCACIDAYRPRLEVWADEEPWTAPRRHPDDPMGFWSSTQEESGTRKKQAWITPEFAGYDDARYFLDCIEQGRESDVPAEAAAAATEVLLAAYQSAATGEVVALPLARS
jgi:predicted dehydrogenase